MNANIRGNDLHFDQAGKGPAIIVLHDDPGRQQALLDDCAPLAASHFKVTVVLTPPADHGCAPVVTLMKHLGIGRAVVIAIGRANYTLVDLMERHPERVVAASFVAGEALARELSEIASNPRSRAMLRSGACQSVARVLAGTRRGMSASDALRTWAARLVDGCRSGIRNCSALLPRLELPGVIHLDDDEEEEAFASETF